MDGETVLILLIIAAAVVALVASCEELLIHLLKKQYDGNTKTVLSLFANK